MKENRNRSVSYDYDEISGCALDHLESLEYSNTKTRRLCLHKNEEAKLHMMVVDLQANASYKSHNHPKSDEIIILLSGQLTIHFEENSICSLSVEGTQSLIIPQGENHSVSCGSNGARYIEIIKGPFLK